MRTKRHRALHPVPAYEEKVLKSLRRIIRAVDLYSRRLVVQHGLSGPQLLALTRLGKGAMRSGVLARELSLSPATVTGILDRLEWKWTPFVGQCGSRRKVESASQRYAAKDRDRIPA